jgi:hypothetical protein
MTDKYVRSKEQGNTSQGGVKVIATRWLRVRTAPPTKGSGMGDSSRLLKMHSSRLPVVGFGVQEALWDGVCGQRAHTKERWRRDWLSVVGTNAMTHNP